MENQQNNNSQNYWIQDNQQFDNYWSPQQNNNENNENNQNYNDKNENNKKYNVEAVYELLKPNNPVYGNTTNIVNEEIQTNSKSTQNQNSSSNTWIITLIIIISVISVIVSCAILFIYKKVLKKNNELSKNESQNVLNHNSFTNTDSQNVLDNSRLYNMESVIYDRTMDEDKNHEIINTFHDIILDMGDNETSICLDEDSNDAINTSQVLSDVSLLS